MIRGEKTFLLPIEREDLNLLNSWKNNESIFKFLGGGFSPVSKNQQEKWIDSLMDLTGNNRRFIIADTKQNKVGFVGLYDINWISRTCEIGVYIGHIESQNKGLAKDACISIESYAKNYLNIRKIKLNVVEENEIAVKFWTKLGYEVVGKLIDERFINGKYCNLLIMEKFI